MSDAVYEIDWFFLDSNSMKLLLMLMTRASKPLEMTIGYIIPVNIDTFIKVWNSNFKNTEMF